MQKLKNYIGSGFQDPAEGKYFTKHSPINGQPIYELPDSTEVDVVKAIQSAQKAFEDWSKTPAAERSRLLMKTADAIDARLDDLARAETQDVGKPLSLSRELDIPRASSNFRFFASAILHKTEMATDMDGEAINYVLRQPVGVAGLIAPWNLPLYLMTWKMAPALACGNTVVCKPSEFTSMTSYLLAEIMHEVGFPKGVVNFVFGQGEPAGRYLVQHPGVPLISFTGGTVTGQRVQTLAAQNVKKLSLELGGKNATIVLKDAELAKWMPQIVRASFLNQGEICLCGSRILVQEEIYDDFCEKFVEEVKKLKVGDPFDETTKIGPLVSAQHRDKVLSCIELAKKDEGRILLGSDPLDLPEKLKNGYFVAPTVIKELTQCSELHQTEVFGPVVSINSFKYPHDAVKWANNTAYGLSASIWTKNLTLAHKLAAGLNVGTVWVNSWLKRDLRVPFGGVKQSGIGREGGNWSLDFFTQTKTVCIQL